MNKSNIILTLVIASSLFVTTSICRAEMLIDPKPISVPEGIGLDKISQAIKRGMKHRAWRVTKEEQGKIIARLSVRNNKHIINETITYNNNYITIKYRDSYNMDYRMEVPDSDDEDDLFYSNSSASQNSDQPVPMIHRKYNSWVKNLASDIKQELLFQY